MTKMRSLIGELSEVVSPMRKSAFTKMINKGDRGDVVILDFDSIRRLETNCNKLADQISELKDIVHDGVDSNDAAQMRKYKMLFKDMKDVKVEMDVLWSALL